MKRLSFSIENQNAPSRRRPLPAAIALGMFAVVTGFAFAPAVKADNLLGNLPATNDNAVLSVGSLAANDLQLAVKFTTSGIPYILDNIELRLFEALTGGPVVVSVHQNDAGGDEPGTLITTLTPPTLADAQDTYTFSAPGVVRLETDTTYWFLVDHGDNSSVFDWLRSSDNPLPAGIATFNKIVSSIDDGASYTEIFLYPSFRINASEVAYQPDLSIGERNNPARARRDNLYNTTAAGQKYAAKIEGSRKEKAWLFIQNDGNDNDTLTLRSNVPRKKLYRLKIFRITGGKLNLTAAVKSDAGFAFPDLVPGERITCLIELKGKGKRGNHTVKYTGTSLKNPARSDANHLKVKPRP